ncbi:TetR/AcrR family transcriptional regulator [Phormidium sp. CLA17]|uniref:TetR/AcrR family transcriptional regulator n=1 Tax=Leptolyngbya sp. Cla-17 TaxID=2803751 RepID=UPI001491A9F9|nr:TetR/AcrR family transcriptional regulator [Leptolyngbya sp. Cla-17]MBM0743376.1 TetR/AcrR family transcriptional regulator [Leptolyngbya sp. Cla-17]
MSKQTYVPFLLDLFRQFGYDGVTLSKISQATGLGKASLYHHFPGGKDEMVETVLADLEQGLEQITLEAVRGEGNARKRLGRMCDRIASVYQDGQKPCLLAALLLGSAKDVFQDKVQLLLKSWIDAIAAVLVEAGMDSAIAQQRGEDGVIAIQGALILAQGLNDPAPFQRVLKQLPQKLWEGIAERH